MKGKTNMAQAGALFRDFRRQCRIDQADLARYLGVHRMTISIWENDEPNLSSEQNRRLVAAGCNPLYFIGAAESPFINGSNADTVKENIVCS